MCQFDLMAFHGRVIDVSECSSGFQGVSRGFTESQGVLRDFIIVP